MRLSLQIPLLLFACLLNCYAQNFPSPASLSTGQGALGADDPNWQVSQQCFLTGTEPNPTHVSVTYSPAIILSGVPPVWIDPATLPAPVNNGNWIGVNASAGNDDGGGCARYYRLTLDLPANCGTVSVTNPGAYSLTFDGYVDNTLMAVYLNGVNQGVPSGGSFAAGGQVTFTIPGPWLVGTNYIDVLVENGASPAPNPAGFLLVASPSAASTDSDGDGINNLNDVCPCESGATANGCPPPNQCNVAAIRSAYLGAGCTELFTCYDGCSLYFYYPTAGSSQAAESFAQTLGGHVVSIQSATENSCLQSELSSHGYSGVIWLGYTDDITEGSFYWLDGSPNGFTSWSAGEPNNAGGNENCVQMYPDGNWNDLDCSSGAASILEVGLCPQATITSNTLQICNGSSATLSVTTAFGSAPYNYTWTPNIGLSTNTSSNPIASPSVSTNYTVQSTDRYGCTTYAYVTLTVNSTPSLTVNSATICLGVQAATLIVSGSNSYSWSPSSDLSSSTGSLVVGNPTATINTYTVTGLTTLGCVSSATTFIQVNSLPNILVSPTSSSICIGQQSSTLTASGAIVYSWTPSIGLSSTTGSNVVADPTVTTTYSVGGLDGFGCPNYKTITIGVNSLPVLSVNSSSICLGQQTATLIANGANTYTWTPPTGLSTLTGSVVLANPNASTTYSIIGTDVNGCFNNTTTSLTVMQLPNISVNSASICIGQQSATLSATGALSYTWIPVSNLSPTTGSMVVANPTVNTTYTVVGIDMNGCYNYLTSTVSVNALPVLIVNSPTICIGQQSATLIVNGANTYTWTPNLNLSSTTGSLVVATPSVTNNYTVSGTDLNGCVNFSSNTITVLPLPILSVNNATICMGQQTATLIANGANTYTWLPVFSTGSVITVMPLTNNTYTVVGQDLSGCLNYTIANVTVVPLPVISVNNASICLGQQTATLIANGGNTYTWSPTASLSSASGSIVTTSPPATSVFTVTVTDNNNCYNVATSTVTIYQLPVISVNSTSVCPGQFPANLLPTGANTYTWNPTVTYNQTNGSDVDANPTVPTTYTVTGIDNNGCFNTASTNVGFYLIPTASLTVSDSVLCIGESFILQPSGGTATNVLPDNLTSSNNFTLFPTTTSSYTIIVFNADGCYSTNDPVVTITVNPLPTISAFSSTIINIGQSTSINASGGLTYVWSPSDGLSCSTCVTTKASPLESTIYTVTGFDINGCASTNTVFVQVDYVCGDYFVPNVFSPNGDGKNDYVNLHSACVGTYTLQIFDRWGEKVFESSDVNYSWDGYFRGKPMDTGVFVYKATGFDIKGTPFSIKGNVTLLR